MFLYFDLQAFSYNICRSGPNLEVLTEAFLIYIMNYIMKKTEFLYFYIKLN